MEKAAVEDPTQESTSMGKVAFASFVGTAIEFYDFYIYGTVAALVLGGIFFPSSPLPRARWLPSRPSRLRSWPGL